MSDAFRFGRASLANIVGLDPEAVLVLSRGLLYSPIDVAVDRYTVRTITQQRVFVSTGRSLTMDSMHLPQSNGYSKAFDLRAVGDINRDGYHDVRDRALVWDRGTYMLINEGIQRGSLELGIPVRWGGTFKRADGSPFFDGPHWELA